MPVTERLKNWLVENAGMSKSASDDDVRKAASEAMIAGKLTAEKFAELTKEEDDEAADTFNQKIDRIADSMEKMVNAMGTEKPTTVTTTAEKAEGAEGGSNENKEEGGDGPNGQKAHGSDQGHSNNPPLPESRISKAIRAIGGGIEAGGEKTVDVRVKEAVESYSAEKSALKFPAQTKYGRAHPLAGQRVADFGQPMDAPSDQDMALAGAWAKYQICCVTPKFGGNPQMAWARLTEHEKSLLCHLAEKTDWDDSKDDKVRTRKGYPGGIKALIDDSTSGGLEAAPIVFDDQVIQTPLLHGELFPYVTTKPLDRGRRVEGVSTGTVTATWGGVDDTAISLFNTASYVSAFDTTVYRWEGAVRIGLDFISDTPLDFGAHITSQYGERMLEDLDDVIAAGNGTTQPEGVVNKTGATSVAWGGTTSIGNYESLRFGVSKSEHRPNVKSSAVFCGTETSYMRSRAIPVGTNDARRIFGYDYDSYSLMQRPYKINESLSNNQIFYAILARYRMYRRKGLSIRTTTEGDTLVRNNEMLIVAMARYGGQLERGACAAVTTTAPA